MKPLNLCLLLICFLIATPFNVDSADNGRYVSIDFKEVDIDVFIKFISELTGKNFIVSNRVKGKVSVISPTKITVEEAYKVFESVLEVHNFTTVKAGKVIKIIPSPDARSKAVETLMKEDALSPEDKIVTQLIPLRYADSGEIKRLIAPLVSKNSIILNYIPTNIIILTDVYSNIKRLMKLMEILDVPGTGQEVSVIPLEFSDSQKIVKTLATVFQRQKKKGSSQSVTKFVADERTNSIIILTSEDMLARIKKLISKLDQEIPKGKGKIRVYYLENATADELAKVLQSLSSKKSSKKTKGKSTSPVVSADVKITADKATNSLIIMAEKEDYLVLEDIIKKLDIPRSMVYIESLIMEVNVDHEFNLGFEWVAMNKASHDGKEGGYGGGFSGGGDQPYSNSMGLIAPGGGAGTLPAGFSLGVFSEAITIGNAIFPNLAAVVAAYKRDKKVHILSTPQILTTDNEEATISVGKNIPYLTKSGSSTVESYNTYEYKDVGIILKITPQISKDRMVRLKIEQESTKLDDLATTGDNRPTTLKRTIATTVIIKDKSTIAIGGLIEDSFTETEHKVPCLGSIPVIGWFFSSLTKPRSKTNLYVFLTPHVIGNPEEAHDLFKIKKEHLDHVEKTEGIKMYPDQKNNTSIKIED